MRNVPISAPHAIGTILIIAVSGFLAGFDGSLFTGAVYFVKGEFALDEFQTGWAVSAQVLTATIAIFLAGPIADRIGRRTTLRIAAIVFAASAIVACAANGLPMLIVARLLSGLGIGAVLVAAPMYIAELSSPALRGRMVTVNQLFLVVGIFLASASNLLIVRMGSFHSDWLTRLNLGSNWRWMLGIGVFPAVAYLFALLFVPESPRWHAMHGRLDAARRILARAHGAALAERELAEVCASLAHDAGKEAARLRDLWAPELRSVLFIGLVVGVLQQITGINSLMAYATMIFAGIGAEGAGIEASFFQTTLLTLVNVVFTVIALLLIDRVGRRPLLIVGTAGIACCLFAAAWGFQASGGNANSVWVLCGLLGFVACFALSLGPVMWVLFSEIFPNRVRALAISCVGLVNSTVCFFAQQVFPWQMQHMGGARTFLIYGMFAVLGVAVLIRILPETRGRSLEELEESLVRHS